MIVLLVVLGAVVALVIIGVVMEVATVARYAPHQPIRGRAYVDEHVGDIGFDEIAVDPEEVTIKRFSTTIHPRYLPRRR